jgi:hypothetical protein
MIKDTAFHVQRLLDYMQRNPHWQADALARIRTREQASASSASSSSSTATTTLHGPGRVCVVSETPAAKNNKSKPESKLRVKPGECDICMDGKKDTVFVKCGHSACGKCAALLLKGDQRLCHVCRAPIESTLPMRHAASPAM